MSRTSVKLILAPMVIILADRFTFVRELVQAGQALFDDQALERREPVLVVAAAGVGFTPGLGFRERGTQAVRPFLVRDLAGLREADDDCKNLSLPWLGEHGPGFIAREQGQIGELGRLLHE
jgi:hypothetical protein